MSFARSSFLAQADAMIQADENEIAYSDRDRAVVAALERYNRDAPDQYTEDVSGDGGRYYLISGANTVLTYFAERFSRVLRIEYPAQAIADDDTPQLLEPEDWDDDYRDGSNNRYLYFPNHAPASGETARVTYTRPYTFASGMIDIPAQDFYALCNLIACELCRYIATKYARTSDSTITGDSVDHAGRSDRFRQMATEFCREYEKQMGIGEFAQQGAAHAAGEFVDWNTAPGWPRGRRWIFDRG